MIIGQTLEHGPRGLPDSPSRGGLLVLLYQPGEVVGCGYWPVSGGLLQVDSVLLAILAGGTLLGLVGAVLAVPVAVVLEVLVLRVLAPAARHASQRASAPPSPPAPTRRARAADAGGQRGKQPAHRAEAGAVRHGATYDPPSSS
jgi:hypothetical protein